MRADILALFLILKENIQLFTIKYNTSCEFYTDTFNILKKFPSSFNLLSVFIVKGCWILSSAFPVSFEMNIFFLIAAWEFLVAVCGIYFPNQRLNPCSLYRDHGVLATGNVMYSLLVSLSCHNKVHRPGSINSRHAFSHSYGSCKSKIKVSGGSFPGLSPVAGGSLACDRIIQSSHGTRMCVCVGVHVKIFPFNMETCHIGLSVYPTPG